MCCGGECAEISVNQGIVGVDTTWLWTHVAWRQISASACSLPGHGTSLANMQTSANDDAGDNALVQPEEDQVSDWGDDAAVYSSDSDLSEWEQPNASDNESLHSEDLHQPDHTASGAYSVL